MHSRFVAEIPAEHIDMPEIEFSGSNLNGTGFASDQRKTTGSFTRKASKISYAPAAAANSADAGFSKGDMVEHKAFGRGMISSIQKMGGDALVEIVFDEIGTKRLMLKSAARHMGKI